MVQNAKIKSERRNLLPKASEMKEASKVYQDGNDYGRSRLQ